MDPLNLSTFSVGDEGSDTLRSVSLPAWQGAAPNTPSRLLAAVTSKALLARLEPTVGLVVGTEVLRGCLGRGRGPVHRAPGGGGGVPAQPFINQREGYDGRALARPTSVAPRILVQHTGRLSVDLRKS